MRLEPLKPALELELHSASAQRAFEQARAKNIELQRYRTLRTLLAVLTSRDPDYQPEKDRLLRVLLLLARLGPVPLLWKSALLYMFLPALWRIRHGYKAPELSAEDLDGSLWNVFFEVVESFPPHRERIATGIVLDTRKLFSRHVQAQEEKRRAFETFLHAFEQLPPEIRSSASVAETGPLMQLDDTDRHEMRAVMSRCPDLTEEDVGLPYEIDILRGEIGTPTHGRAHLMPIHVVQLHEGPGFGNRCRGSNLGRKLLERVQELLEGAPLLFLGLDMPAEELACIQDYAGRKAFAHPGPRGRGRHGGLQRREPGVALRSLAEAGPVLQPGDADRGCRRLRRLHHRAAGRRRLHDGPAPAQLGALGAGDEAGGREVAGRRL